MDEKNFLAEQFFSPDKDGQQIPYFLQIFSQEVMPGNEEPGCVQAASNLALQTPTCASVFSTCVLKM